MSISNLTNEQVEGRLTRAAKGLYAGEAAVRLLIEHGVWPARLAHAGLIDLDADGGNQAGERYAWVNWHAATAALGAGELHGSGSAVRILRIAASLAGQRPSTSATPSAGLTAPTWPWRWPRSPTPTDPTSTASRSSNAHHLVGDRSSSDQISPQLDLGAVCGWPT